MMILVAMSEDADAERRRAEDRSTLKYTGTGVDVNVEL